MTRKQLDIFYNTTSESGETLQEFEAKAKNQEDIIQKTFAYYRKLSASQCATIISHLHGIDPPLTSVRRAITNLKNKNILVRTENKRKGIYGRPEYIYEFVEEK